MPERNKTLWHIYVYYIIIHVKEVKKMRAVVRDWQPRNRITTPLAGTPSYVNSGIIKAVMKSGEKISVAQIDYQEFDEENFQYVISPYWESVDGLPASVFQGILGIDMDLRLEMY